MYKMCYHVITFLCYDKIALQNKAFFSGVVCTVVWKKDNEVTDHISLSPVILIIPLPVC